MSERPEMEKEEFVKAMFFSSDADFAAANASADAKPKRRSRAAGEEIKALRKIVRGFNTIESIGENAMIAALNYINDRYGKRLNPHRWTR